MYSCAAVFVAVFVAAVLVLGCCWRVTSGFMSFRGGGRGGGRGRNSRGRRGRGGRGRGSVRFADTQQGGFGGGGYKRAQKKNKKKSAGAGLFDSSSSDDEAAGVGAGGFTINEAYAKRFEDRARRRALWEAKQRGMMAAVNGDDSDESPSETEDEGEELTPALDVEIMRTIQMIRDKNPKIYKKDNVFYRSQTGGGATQESTPGQAKPAAKKPLRASDVMAAQIKEAVATGRADAFEEDEGMAMGVQRNIEGSKVKAYDAEQRQLRAAFTSVVDEQLGDEEGGAAGKGDAKSDKKSKKKKKKNKKKNKKSESSDEEEDDLFAVKIKSKKDEEKDAEDYQAFLESNEGKTVKLKMEKDEKEALQRFFATQAEDENEQFLRDYVLNRKWQMGDDGAMPSYVHHCVL